MKVIGWGNFDELYPNHKYSLNDICTEAVVREIIENNYDFSSWYHQAGPYGCPILSDGSMYRCSERGWGMVMAKAILGETSDEMAYCDWAFYRTDKKTPKEKEIKIEDFERTDYNETYPVFNFKSENGVLTEYIGKLKKVVIPQGVEEIEKSVFLNNETIEEVIIEAEVVIDRALFYGCKNLKKVYLSDDVELANKYIFLGAPNVTVYCGGDKEDMMLAMDWDIVTVTSTFLSDVINSEVTDFHNISELSQEDKDLIMSSEIKKVNVFYNTSKNSI